MMTIKVMRMFEHSGVARSPFVKVFVRVMCFIRKWMVWLKVYEVMIYAELTDMGDQIMHSRHCLRPENRRTIHGHIKLQKITFTLFRIFAID